MTTWFTSDLHLGHLNIIEYCHRPYRDVQKMNEDLVDGWNQLVEPEDTVYVLGDLALGKIENSMSFAAQLQGHKRLVPGNHDRCWQGHSKVRPRDRALYEDAGFVILDGQVEHRISYDLTVQMCHFPYAGDSQEEDRYQEHRPVDRGQWLLHGHVHDSWAVNGRQINVGVDVNGYQPVSDAEIMLRVQTSAVGRIQQVALDGAATTLGLPGSGSSRFCPTCKASDIPLRWNHHLPREHTVTATAIAAQPKTWSDAEFALASSLPGYESRPQQTALATRIESLYAGSLASNVLLAQAGCGTGKSLAGLIPSILSGKRVIVATATKALQGQYVAKDVPFLSEHLGVPFTWALLKGKSNYLCRAKVIDRPSRISTQVLAEIEQAEGHDGDLDTVSTIITPSERRDMVSTTDECPGRSECPFGKVCFAEMAKDQAKRSQVVITNTAMLATDLKIYDRTDGLVSPLGRFDAVLVDEAHELEEIVTNNLAERITKAQMERLLTDVRVFANRYDDLDESLNTANFAIQALWEALPAERGLESIMSQQWFLEREEIFSDALAAFIAVSEAVMGLNTLGDDKAKTRQAILSTRATNFADRIKGAMFISDDEMVRWMEDEDINGKTVTCWKMSYISVADFLNRSLWTRPANAEGDLISVVLLSATLSVGGDFTFVQESLGVEGCETLNVGTPFDYATQAMLYVPEVTFPVPSKQRQAWANLAPVRAAELIKISGGGALVLCTSRASMRAMHDVLVPMLESRGITVLLQGGGDSNKVLSEKFAEDTDSVLIATKSFFTGVDFAGETCRLVIIDKLPFPVPTDVIFAARSRRMDKKAGRSVSFQRLSIPMMTLVLEQAYGRLIRSLRDRGVVAILDGRLSSTGWGQGIVRNLPDSPATTSLPDVEGFFFRV